MPMSIVGGHGGSFRKINPQLSQTVESLKVISQSLNQAPANWWKSASLSIPEPAEEYSASQKSESDEENLVDLQQNENFEAAVSSGDEESEWEN